MRRKRYCAVRSTDRKSHRAGPIGVMRAQRLPSTQLCSYAQRVITVSASVLRARQRDCIELVQREPVRIIARDGASRAVLVSPTFFDRAVTALEDLADLQAAAAVRVAGGEVVAHDALMAEMGINEERRPQ